MNINIELLIDQDTWLEVGNIADGTFAPLTGFLNQADYRSVVEDMHLVNGQPWSIPITLAIPDHQVESVRNVTKLDLVNSALRRVAEVEVSDIYTVEMDHDVSKVFGTSDTRHPGVNRERLRSKYRVGGKITLIEPYRGEFPQYALSPQQTKAIFAKRGWQTIAGFQTRNPVHRAHEYLQRIAMELTDGIFIQPLIGWKKADDFAPAAIVASYEKQLAQFYSEQRALFGVLRTPMRYAGPREAVFHAIIRRNHGCTHFIVGRDHAGVGNYYGKYDAHKLCAQFNDLGITILPLMGPYYCKACKTIVTEKTCRHGSEQVLDVSGTDVRRIFSTGKLPPEEYMRPEIATVLQDLAIKGELFVGG